MIDNSLEIFYSTSISFLILSIFSIIFYYHPLSWPYSCSMVALSSTQISSSSSLTKNLCRKGVMVLHSSISLFACSCHIKTSPSSLPSNLYSININNYQSSINNNLEATLFTRSSWEGGAMRTMRGLRGDLWREGREEG